VFRKTEDILANIPDPNGKKTKDKLMYNIYSWKKGYKTIKSSYDVISGNADVYLDKKTKLLGSLIMHQSLVL
jgi:hypothetical protein